MSRPPPFFLAPEVSSGKHLGAAAAVNDVDIEGEWETPRGLGSPMSPASAEADFSLPQSTLGVRRTAGLDLILVMIVRHLSIFGNVNGGLGWPSC